MKPELTVEEIDRLTDLILYRVEREPLLITEIGQRVLLLSVETGYSEELILGIVHALIVVGRLTIVPSRRPPTQRLLSSEYN